MLEIVRKLNGEKPIISIVGAGGKTTIMYRMAKRYAEYGFKVLVTTTTHIWEPLNNHQAKNLSEAHGLWNKNQYVIVGEACDSGKWSALSENELKKYIQCADVVLIEADGAKGKPCKIPNEHEPVILPESNVVVNVVGMDAIGKEWEKSCFRYSELIEKGLEEHEVITEEALVTILTSKKLGRKFVDNRLYYVVLNKCDTSDMKKVGERIRKRIMKSGMVEEVMCTSRHQLGWIVVRGAGDLATGILYRLHTEGYKVLALETEKPAAIRRKVAFSEAVYDNMAEVEGVQAELINVRYRNDAEFELKLNDWAECIAEKGRIPIVVDPEGKSISLLRPVVVIDAILAKCNLGTSIDMAPFTIALGPGFEAGKDVHVVIETMRGESLGDSITEGYAIANTGIPGKINGIDKERVIHAPISGMFCNVKCIGDIIEQGEVIAYIKVWSGEELETEVVDLEKVVEIRATIPGVLRGLLRDEYYVNKGFKVADIEPRIEERGNCNKITDKARKIADSVLGVILDEKELF